uniref:EF-hand domain-containing protein n=1 Tax=Megaviridae environmental sample TaxID=1737588 RepID=A0A5J6VM24_9VIRU|nr:MAG: hypothetical protein [Megaviridae environmental sample]
MKKKTKQKKTKSTSNNFLLRIKSFIHRHVILLNSSKFFAGMMMLLLNIGSKYATVQFSNSQQAALRNNIGRQLLVFAVAWMGTKDIYTSFFLTAAFMVLADYLFNENSLFCILPKKYKDLKDQLDLDGDGIISEDELNQAIKILKKAHKEKKVNAEKKILETFILNSDEHED